MSRQRHNQKMLPTTAPSLSKDEVLKCTGQKDNFLQFARLIMVAGTRLFRDLFNHVCPPETLREKLSYLVKKLPRVNHQERKRLYPLGGRCVTSDDFDICLLFKLLQVCGFEEPDGGWDELPKESDHKVLDELVRIKYYRNQICHPCYNHEISDESFFELWEFIKGAMIGIAKYLPEGSEPWESAIDQLSKLPITSAEEQCAKELNEWYFRDMDFKKELQEVKNVCSQIYLDTKKLSKEMADLKASVASIIDSSGNNNSNRDPPAIDAKNLPAKRLLKTKLGDLPSKSRELTKQFFLDAIDIERDGVGLYAAVCALSMECVVVKRVFDFADGKLKKSDTDAWRPNHASVMAASLTVHILGNPMAFQHVPHYKGAVTKDVETQTEITMNDKLFQQSVITTCQGENPDGQSLEEGLKRKAAEDIDRVAKRPK